jgi:hypothetical protein
MKKVSLIVAFLVLMGATAASATPSQNEALEAGIQLSQITYKEPGLMNESGFMYGLFLSYSNKKELMAKFDGLLAFGQMKYEGSTQSGEPLTVSGIKDTMMELRAVFGPVEPLSDTLAVIPYIGFGYRYLYDGLNNIPGGYRRESNYLYLPIGIESPFPAKTGWSLGFTLEFDLFLQGKQVSHFSDVDPGYNDIENGQTSGYGLRGSVRFIKAGRNDIIIEPFVKYWKIGESGKEFLTYYGSPMGVAWEPANNSTEIGVRCTMRF